MNKKIPIADLPLLVGSLGLLSAAVRLWQILRGVDDRGLLIQGYPAGAVQLVLLGLVTAILVFRVRFVGDEPGYNRNFPRSLWGAVGTALAAACIFVTAVQQFLAKDAIILDYFSAVVGVCAGPLLLLAAKGRLEGKKVSCLLHAPASLFLGLWLFTRCRIWGAEPEIWRFFPDLVAVLALMIASSQLTAFDVDMGQRNAYLFWGLLAAYGCIAALPGSETPLLLAGGAVWMLTNLCALRLKRRRAPIQKEEAEVAKQPDTPIDPLTEEPCEAADCPAEVDRWIRMINELEQEEP